MRRMFAVIDSISCRMWLETMMLLPARPQSLIMRIVLRRMIGSMPESGSSRIRSWGSRARRRGRVLPRPPPLLLAAPLLFVGSGGLSAPPPPRAGAARGRDRFRIAQSVQPHERGHPLEAGHALVEGILFGTEADAEVERRVAPDRFAEDGDAALARPELTGDQLHERRLAGAVRSEE